MAPAAHGGAARCAGHRLAEQRLQRFPGGALKTISNYFGARQPLFHLQDLEEDPELRTNVNIYRDPNKVAVDDSELEDDDGVPRITLAEMLDEMTIDATGGDGADMVE